MITSGGWRNLLSVKSNISSSGIMRPFRDMCVLCKELCNFHSRGIKINAVVSNIHHSTFLKWTHLWKSWCHFASQGQSVLASPRPRPHLGLELPREHRGQLWRGDGQHVPAERNVFIIFRKHSVSVWCLFCYSRSRIVKVVTKKNGFVRLLLRHRLEN